MISPKYHSPTASEPARVRKPLLRNLRHSPDESNPDRTWLRLWHNLGPKTNSIPGPGTEVEPKIGIICSEEISTEAHVTRHQSCATQYHYLCFGKWIQERQNSDLRPNCPHCRGELHMNQIAKKKRNQVLRKASIGALALAEEQSIAIVHEFYGMATRVLESVYEQGDAMQDPLKSDINEILNGVQLTSDTSDAVIRFALSRYYGQNINMIAPDTISLLRHPLHLLFQQEDDDYGDDSDDVVSLFDS